MAQRSLTVNIPQENISLWAQKDLVPWSHTFIAPKEPPAASPSQSHSCCAPTRRHLRVKIIRSSITPEFWMIWKRLCATMSEVDAPPPRWWRPPGARVGTTWQLKTHHNRSQEGCVSILAFFLHIAPSLGSLLTLKSVGIDLLASDSRSNKSSGGGEGATGEVKKPVTDSLSYQDDTCNGVFLFLLLCFYFDRTLLDIVYSFFL